MQSPQDFLHVASNHRFELENVTHKEQLLAPKRFAHVTRIDFQYLVDEIDDIASQHRNLIDDDKVEFAYELYLLSRVTQSLANASWREIGVIGQEWFEGYLEKRVQRLSSHINGGNTCRSQHHVFLLGVGTDILEKSAFSCARFSR